MLSAARLSFVSLILFSPLSLHAAEKETEAPVPAKAPVTVQGSVTIAGKKIPYQASTGKIQIRDDKGKATASMFSISYQRTDVEDTKQRPVMFAFNGGPGSSSVWLHLGILGPKRVEFSGDGTQPMTAPARLIPNDMSILDDCDLVFIDPISTGYSRAEKEAKDFHGYEADIESVGEFIRIWTTENKRWASPKYLCGESYGAIRAAGLAEHLQSRYGMSLNGVVLLSGLLDFRTIVPAQGSLLSHQIFLPSYASTALFHKKISGEREAILQEAKEFSYGAYGAALLKGSEISAQELEVTAAKLAALTGVSAEIWTRKKLRLDPFEFRAELLRAEGKVIGRFDSRVAWPSTDPNASFADSDPSYSLAIGAFSTAMLSYLGDELGWKEDQAYEVLTSKVNPWNYGSDNRIVNLTSTLCDAVRDNPMLRILVMGAHADLATPPEGILYSLKQMTDLPAEHRKQFSYTFYDAGHMFYLNPPDLKKARTDLIEFLKD